MDLNGRDCVVIGGGEVAARKVESLLSCGAAVTVIAPKLAHDIAVLAKGGAVTHVAAEYSRRSLAGRALVIAATDNEKVNHAVYEDAVHEGVPVNVVDVPELCTFIVPSVVERGDLLIAISTSGKSPAMAKRIRREMEERFGPEYGEMVDLMGEVRRLVREREPDLDKRMRILTAVANSDLLERIRGGERPSAEAVLADAEPK